MREPLAGFIEKIRTLLNDPYIEIRALLRAH